MSSLKYGIHYTSMGVMGLPPQMENTIFLCCSKKTIIFHNRRRSHPSIIFAFD